MGDTIFALATAPGRAAVAVVRLSGPGSAEALRAMGGRLPAARRASLRSLKDKVGAVIDRALVLWFPAPHSYTGEDCAELHLHGGTAVVEAASEALLGLGLRPAEPGEFTRRAFENGKLDLAQAEGVADLIDAQTTAQAKQALDQMGGALSARHEAWRAMLLESLAFLEAAVDFPDEEVPPDVAGRAVEPLKALIGEFDRLLELDHRGEQIRNGYRVALIGAPNAGKSSLFNALSDRDAAIVTPEPGTTRDVIESHFTLAGYRVILADTAGVRETAEAIEAEGVRRAQAWAAQADLRLWVVDASTDSGAWEAATPLLGLNDILILTKRDLGCGPDGNNAWIHAQDREIFQHEISLLDPAGVAEVLDHLRDRVIGTLSGGDFPAVTRARHAASLREARDRLLAALDAREPELVAEDVRLAARALGRITGRIDAEQVLDLVFGKFCIGK